MDENQVDSLLQNGQRMANRILSFHSTRDHVRDLSKAVWLDNFGSTIRQICLRDGQDDRIDDRRGLKDTKGMDQERQPSQQAKLFADCSAHPEA